MCSYRLTQSFLRLTLIFRVSQSEPLNIKWSKSDRNDCSLNKSDLFAKRRYWSETCFFSPLGICACVPKFFGICVHLVFQLLPQLPCFRLPSLVRLVLPGCACLHVCIEWAVSPKEGLRCCHAMTPPICCCPVKRSWRQRSGHPRRGAATQSASCLPASQCYGIGPASCTHTHTHKTHADSCMPRIFGSLCGGAD